MLTIKKITSNKKQYLELLLQADEQEDMIDKYLPKGDLFALYDDDLKTVAVVIEVDSETCELKNISTIEEERGKGYGRKLISYLTEIYKKKYRFMLVGTGETPAILAFYTSCGFVQSHRIPRFFIDNYNHPMFDGDVQLVDMIYLKKELALR